jgi:UDP-N-acetylmuramoyl-L-alanyl-D-glutamate--2,6-diaminopimelate ligase
MVTSVNAVIGDRVLETGLHVTTPGPGEIQAFLAQMVSAGTTHCILETTSHGLAQRRVEACDFDLAVVTNITHEHLDYHGSYEAYRAAKARLVSDLATSAVKPGAPPKKVVLNHDDGSYDYLREVSPVDTVSYGFDRAADMRACEVGSDLQGLQFIVEGGGSRITINSPLLGDYNVSNCLAAYTAAVEGLQLDISAAVAGIAAVERVAGRMEVIDMGQDFIAIVDFAHTPNALGRALEAARELTTGKVIAVFGSAGLRDREKRRLMAQVSARTADLTVLTAEDPRTESLDLILEEMAQGAQVAGGLEGQTFWRVPDRGEALRFAVRQAQPGDLVIACGKGHEQSMCFGQVEHSWDDRVALRAALAETLGIEGPQMPLLPTSM